MAGKGRGVSMLWAGVGEKKEEDRQVKRRRKRIQVLKSELLSCPTPAAAGEEVRRQAGRQRQARWRWQSGGRAYRPRRQESAQQHATRACVAKAPRSPRQLRDGARIGAGHAIWNKRGSVAARGVRRVACAAQV